MRRLLGIGSLYTLGGVAQMAAAAVAVPAVTRLLGAREYGEVTVVVAILVLLAPLIALGIPAAIARLFYGADELTEAGPDMARKLVGTCAVAATLGVALTAASCVFWSSLLAPVGQLALLVGIAAALPMTVMGATALILQVEQRPAAYLTVSLLGSAGAQVLGIGAMVLVETSPTVYLAGYASGVTMAAVLGMLLSNTVGSGLADRRAMRAALAIGLPTIPHTMAILVLALGDRVVIQSIDGPAAVGRYQVAYALGALPLALLAAVQTAWVPITFGASPDRRWVDLASSSVVITRLGALLVAALAVLSPIGLGILAPASFDPGELQTVCSLVALGALPWSIYLPMSQVLFWERQTTALLWVTPLAAVANLILVALLLPPLGLEGAAAATLLALALQAALLERVSRKLASVPWHWRAMLGNLGAGAVTVLVVLLLPGNTTGDILRGLLLIVMVAIAAKTVSDATRTREPRGTAVP